MRTAEGLLRLVGEIPAPTDRPHPGRGPDRPRRRQALPISFTDDELARIPAAAARGASTVRDAQRWPARDPALLALLAGCGLRASEVCSLTWAGLADLDQAEPGVRVRAKGGRQRRVPLAPRITAALLEYRQARTTANSSGPLSTTERRQVIVQTDGRAVTPSVLTGWVTNWLADAQVSRRSGALAHAFRHTAADGWLASGATLAELQALLGHASMATTGIYTKVRPETFGDVVRVGRLELILNTSRTGVRSDRTAESPDTGSGRAISSS
jgi:integrase/recombinase XerD